MASIVKECENSKDEKNKSEEVDLEEVDCNECYSLFWKAKIITVEPIIFFYTFATSFSVYFSYQYFYHRYARDRLPQPISHFCISEHYLNDATGNNDTFDEVEDRATHLTFLSTLTSLLISIVFTIIIGPLTDRFGRRFALVSVNFGSMINSLLVMIIVYLELNLYYYVGASLVSSFFGGYGSLFGASFSYVADISSHKTRSLRIAMIEMMIYVTAGLTSVLVGIWLSEVDCNFASLTWVPFCCYILSLLYTILLLPESVSEAQRQALAKKSGLNKLKVLWKGILLYFRPKLVTVKLWICLGVLLIVVMNITGSLTINTYFYIGKPLEWNPTQIGLFGGYSQLTHGLALLLVMPLAVIIGIPDVFLAIIGVIGSCLGYLLIAGVRKTWQLYAISSFKGIEAIVVPVVRSMMSKYVSKDEQGALFAVVSSVEVSAALIGSSVYTNLYPTLHQTSYFIMSVVTMVPIIPLCLVLIMEICARRGNCGNKDKQMDNSASDTDEKSSLLTS